jgi:sugar-specific transcriptional regulator TrmB
MKLGLSEKEAKVYIATLELGASTVQNIAQKAAINRPTAYVVLESLLKQGLVTTCEQGKKTLFAAEPPERLDTLLKNLEQEVKEKTKELGDIMPDLRAIFSTSGNKPRVKYYEGIDGIKSMQEDAISKIKPGYIEYAVNDLDHLFGKIPSTGNHVQQRVKNKAKIFVIYTRSEGPLPEANDPSELRVARYVPKDKFPFNSIFTIIPDFGVRITKFTEPLMGVVIEDPGIATAMKVVWDLAWEAAEKYNNTDK